MTREPSTIFCAITAKRSEYGRLQRVSPRTVAVLPKGDVWKLTAALVDIASESFREQEIVALLESELRACDHLTVDRIGDNLVARTDLGRKRRLVLGGHTDTVPASDNAGARIAGERMFGVGTTDMKGGVATIVDLARTVTEPAVDVTYVLYAREEVAAIHNGLREIEAERRASLKKSGWFIISSISSTRFRNGVISGSFIAIGKLGPMAIPSLNCNCEFHEDDMDAAIRPSLISKAAN